MQIIANVEKPDEYNVYKASKNKRKSTITLPPFSCVYVLNAVLVIICRVRFLLQSSLIATSDKRNC